MNPTWAEENLQTIRTLMENTAVYRRALTPIMLWLGALGTAGAVVGLWQHVDYPTFVWYWLAVAVLAVGGAFGLARRQALRDREPFWSGPTRRVAQAVVTPLLAGTVLTVLADYHTMIAVGVWVLLYGCALRAAGFFTPPGVGRLGWLFVAAGALILATQWRAEGVVVAAVAHRAMGVCFGGFHLAYGVYLAVTKKS